jgi:hypothetical protein
VAGQIVSKPNVRRAGIRTGSGARFSLISERTAVGARGYRNSRNAVIWIIDAQRGDGKQLFGRTNAKLTTALMEGVIGYTHEVARRARQGDETLRP